MSPVYLDRTRSAQQIGIWGTDVFAVPVTCDTIQRQIIRDESWSYTDAQVSIETHYER